MQRKTLVALATVLSWLPVVVNGQTAEPLPNTQPLTLQGDLAEQMVAGIDRFLLRETADSIARRPRHWQPDRSSAAAYQASLAPNRQRLAKIIGAFEPREKITAVEILATTDDPGIVGEGENFVALAVRWPALRGVCGEGLLLKPKQGRVVADVVAIPDADQSPEQLAGLVAGIPPESQFARRLAESGCRVLVPALIDRADAYSASPARGTNQPHREFLYRPAFEMGRHIIGYEVQKVLAAVDWFMHQAGSSDPSIGLIGYGEGGLLALHASALDSRIDAVCVSGYFDSRQALWKEPIYRNVFSLLDAFGDAELASMVAPRALVVEACQPPQVSGPPAPRHGHSPGAAPGVIATPALASVQAELERAKALVGQVPGAKEISLVASDGGNGSPGSEAALGKLLTALDSSAKLSPLRSTQTSTRPIFDGQARLKRLFDQINADTQHVLAEAEYTRAEYWKDADRASRDVQKFQTSTQSYRKRFYDEVIGRFDRKPLSANPRSRQIFDQPLYTGYEVVLDVFPDVFAYGILLVP